MHRFAWNSPPLPCAQIEQKQAAIKNLKDTKKKEHKAYLQTQKIAQKNLKKTHLQELKGIKKVNNLAVKEKKKVLCFLCFPVPVDK
jgi:hypothetical protein